MQFAINYNDGYEVCVLMENEQGFVRFHPLRNFGDHQGDAKIYKLHDCPNLSDMQIRALVKNFRREVKYKRVSERRFIREGKPQP